MKISDHSLLGPAPCWRGLLKWFLCIPVAAGSWHLYKLYPVGGLVAVGLTPFACLFLFSMALPDIAHDSLSENHLRARGACT